MESALILRSLAVLFIAWLGFMTIYWVTGGTMTDAKQDVSEAIGSFFRAIRHGEKTISKKKPCSGIKVKKESFDASE